MRKTMLIAVLAFCALHFGVFAEGAYYGEGVTAAFDLNGRGALVSPDGAVVHNGGTLAANETWSAGSVHVVYGTVVIPSNVVLTVANGATVKFVAGGILSEGKCVAKGATFTDIDDGTGLAMPSYILHGNFEMDAATQIRFARNGDEFEAEGASAAFDLNGRGALVSPDGAVVHDGGTLAADETWATGNVHVVYGTLIVAEGVTLTIEPGAVVKFVAGGLYAVGTCVANGVTFTDIGDVVGRDDPIAPSGGHAGRVTLPSYRLDGNIETDATTRIKYAKLGDEFAANGDSDVFRLDIPEDEYRFAHEGEEITYSASWGNGNAVKVTVTNPQGGTSALVDESGEASGIVPWDVPTAPGLYRFAHQSGGETLTAGFIVLDGAVVHDGTLASDETWAKDVLHIIGGNTYVPAGVTLTIESGAVVKFADGKVLSMSGGGICNAEGAIFTSIADDTAGGDTLADGDATAPAENSWTILGLVNDNVATEYRYGTFALCGSIGADVTWRKEKTYVIDGTLTVASGVTLTIPAGTVVKFTDGSSLAVENGGECIAKGVIFTHIADDVVGGDTMGDGDATTPEYGKYKVEVNIVEDDMTEYRYYVPTTLSATISTDTTLCGNRVYVASNDVTVANGATLTVGNGATIKFVAEKSLRLQSGSHLIAKGTRSRPIVFTSIKDDAYGGDTNGDGDGSVAYPGDWGGVIANGAQIEAEYAQFLFGGGVSGNVYGARASCFMWDNASGVFSGCRFSGSPMDGCFAQNAIFSNCIFDDNDRGLVSHTGTITANNCVAANNRIGFFSHTSALVVRNSISSLNTESAITGDGGSRETSNCYFGDDPKFLDSENGDYRIAADSPCVDAGDAAYAPEKDYYGQPRNGKPDIGIHEAGAASISNGVDLEAVEVSASGDSFTVGDSVTVKWKVRNIGSVTAQGPWTDTISAIDSSGAVVTLGTVATSGPLSPGATIDREATFWIPAMAEGAWHVRLMVNSGHEVFEGVSTENNVLEAVQSVNILVPVADTSAPFNTTSNSFVRLLVDDDSSKHVIELRTPGIIQVRYGFGFAPTGSRLSGSLATIDGRLRIIVPEGVKDIYLDLSSGNETDTEYAIEIKAQSASPFIDSIWPCSVANAGSQTFTVSGESMEGVSRAEFISGVNVVAAKILTLGESEVTIAADCSLFASGASYDLHLVDDSGATVLRNAVKVNAAEHHAKLKYSITFPQTVRLGRKYVGFVDYANEGDADMQAPILIITETKGGAMLSLKEDGDFTSSVAFVAIGSSSPHGVLRAGDRMRLPFYFWANSSFYIQIAELDYSSTQKLESVFPTWNEYANGLVDAASRLNSNAKADTYDINDLREYALRRAYGCPSAVLHGILKDAVTQEPIPHSRLGVYDGDSLVDNVTTDDRGLFSFVSLETNVEYSVHCYDANVKDNRFVLGLEEYPFITLQAYERGKCTVNVTGVDASDEITVHLTNDISGETFVTNRVGEGWCTIDGLDDGYYRLSACSSGFNFTTNRYDIIVNDGAITNAVPVFEFMPAGVAEVSVFAISGDPVTNVCVTLYDENFCSVASDVTDEDGCVMLKCFAGNYMLGIGEGYQLAESKASISVGRGRVSTVELKVKKVPFFAAPSMGVMPLTTTFYMIATNGMASIISCEWDFDNDGIVDSREFQPSFTYETPGEKDVALTLHFEDGSVKTFMGDKIVDVWEEEIAEPDDGTLTLDERSGWEIISRTNNVLVLQANGLAIAKLIQGGTILIDPENPLMPYNVISVSLQNGNPHVIEVETQSAKLTKAYRRLRVTTSKLIGSSGGGGSWGPERHSSPWISFLNMQETTLGLFNIHSWSLQKKFSYVIDDNNLKSFEVETVNSFDISLVLHDKTFLAERESLFKKEGWDVFYGVPISWEAELYWSGNVKGEGCLDIKGGSASSSGWRSDVGNFNHPKHEDPMDLSLSGSLEADLKIAVRGNADVGMTSSIDEEGERQKYGYALFGVELEGGLKVDVKLKKADELHPDSYSQFVGWYIAGDLYFSRATWGEKVDWSVLRSKFDTSETSESRYSWETPMPNLSAHTVKRTKTSMTVSFKSFTRPDPDYRLRSRNWDFGDGMKGDDNYEIVHTYNVAPGDSYWVDVALREGYNYTNAKLSDYEMLPVKAYKYHMRISGGGDDPPPPPPPPPGPPPPPPGGGGPGGIIKSEDPNEVAGPLGVGEARYVKAGEEMLYTVYFENKSDASAAAQDIYITNPLSEWLDWSTFEMGDVGFCNQTDHNLNGLKSGVSEVAQKGTGYYVQSSVALDESAGRVKVELHIIDKTTKYGVPEDPYAGILPPNDDTHRGEGHITYRIKVRDDAPNNVIITNSATIVFDRNTPIVTDPSWWNTVTIFHDVALEIDGVTTNLTLIAGEPFGELPVPKTARTGFTFDAWYTGENGTGTKVTSTAIVPDGDFTLYDNWTGNPYKVRFNANGGTGTMADQAFVYGTAQKLASNAFKRKMYAFAGWARSTDGAAEFTDGQSVENLATAADGVFTLYAVWTMDRPVLWEEVTGAVSAVAASVYDGYLYDGDGNVKGTIQVKVGKPNAKTKVASVKATVIGLDGKKKSLKAIDKGKAVIAPDSTTDVYFTGGDTCMLTLGQYGMSGRYGNLHVDGSRNLFTSKNKGEQSDASAMASKWAAVNVAWDEGILSVATDKKGKAKISGSFASGTKVSAKSQMIIGADWCCVPVAWAKKGESIAFVLWMRRDGGAGAMAVGLGNDVKVGTPTALKGGAEFCMDTAGLCNILGGGATYEDYLPDGISVERNGMKWIVAGGAKAGKVTISKDGTVDGTKAGANPSALKLSYKAKDGTFTGSFKAYAKVNGKPKATTVNVTGVMVGDSGYGLATIKKRGSVTVTIK